MTVVFVHGNPETPVIWNLLAARLAEGGYTDQVRLSPPGFGAPVPEEFEATVLEYRDWLIAELERVEPPIDLVGHDWGGGHTVNVAMVRPDLLRSWTSDTVGLFEPDYLWHPLAQGWQTAGEGEIALAKVLGQPPTERAKRYTDNRMDPDIARQLAESFDERMASVILPLYRSARQPVMADLGVNLEAAGVRPGLAIIATEDPTSGSVDLRQRAAARAGARVEVLEGFGHWWMTEGQGQRGAAVLTAFWSTL